MGKNRIFSLVGHPAIYWSLVSKPVSQDIQSICYCLHTGTFRLDTRDLLVAGVPISISSKYLYLYLALKVLTVSPDSLRQLLVTVCPWLMLRSYMLYPDLLHVLAMFPNLQLSYLDTAKSNTREFPFIPVTYYTEV